MSLAPETISPLFKRMNPGPMPRFPKKCLIVLIVTDMRIVVRDLPILLTDSPGIGRA